MARMYFDYFTNEVKTVKENKERLEIYNDEQKLINVIYKVAEVRKSLIYQFIDPLTKTKIEYINSYTVKVAAKLNCGYTYIYFINL